MVAPEDDEPPWRFDAYVFSGISSFDTTAASIRSPVTFNVVLHMSRNRSTPRIKPMPSAGTPTMVQIKATTGNEPAGTPAVPIPPRMHTNITVSCCESDRSTPKNWARKRTVMPSNRAVPF